MIKVVLNYEGEDGKVYGEDLELDIIPRENESVKIKYADFERNFIVTGIHHDISAGFNNHEITIFAEKQK